MNTTFADYKADGHNWITLSTGEYYPDILPLAAELYTPVLVLFGQMVEASHSSIDLFMRIAGVTQTFSCRASSANTSAQKRRSRC